MNIVTQEAAEEDFLPYFDEMTYSVHAGMERYLQIPAEFRTHFTSTGKANVLNGFVREEVEKFAERHSEIQIKREAQNSLEVVVKNKYALRVKKLHSKTDRTGNVNTGRVKAIETGDLPLLDLEQPPVWLVWGYKVNDVFNAITQVSLSHQDGKHVNWSIPITNTHEQERMPFITNEQIDEVPEPVVSARKKAKARKNV